MARGSSSARRSARGTCCARAARTTQTRRRCSGSRSLATRVTGRRLTSTAAITVRMRPRRGSERPRGTARRPST
eukprot:7564514-Alexandrium_andersonii.AAC.1